jgi:hypothetical protein
MIGEEPLQMLSLRDQSCKLAVEGDEVGVFDLFKNEVDVLFEVVSINLHQSLIIKLYTPNNTHYHRHHPPHFE